MKRTLACSILSTGLGLAALTGVADSSDASWQYVSPIPAEWRARRSADQFNPTGVITNGDFRLFVRDTGNSHLALGTYSGGWGPADSCALLDGSGVLDLSKPIYVEGTDTRLTLTRTYGRCFRVANATVTDLIMPRELETVDDYLFLAAFSALTNVVMDCPNLATIGHGAFHSCTKITRLRLHSDAPIVFKGSRSNGYCFIGNRETPVMEELKIEVTQPFTYQEQICWYLSFANMTVDDFSFDKALAIGKEAFNSGGGKRAGLTGCARFPILQTLGVNAFASHFFESVEIGYDDLREVGSNPFVGNSVLSLMIVGKGPSPVRISSGLINRNSWEGRRPYRVFFRGDKPDFSSAGTDWVFNDQSGNRTSRIYIPYGDASWNDVIAAAEPCTQVEFNAAFPGDTAEAIGVIPEGTIGNRGAQYLCYDDYRRYESDLFVTGAAGEYGTVSPSYGVHRQYGAGDVILLTAPSEAIDLGDMKVRATKYVVETIDRRGRWIGAVTNDYVAGSSSVTLPADGRSVRVTWLFERQMRVSLASLMTADYPDEEVRSSVTLDADGCAFVSEGDTVTLTASSKSTGLPRTRFVRWDGDIGEADATDATLTLTMDRARHVRAVFSHGWELATNNLITDGVWTLYVAKLSDGPDGEKRLRLGYSWETAYRGYTGTLGAIDLSAPIEDASGNSYVITSIETCALRADNTSQYVPDNTIIKDLTLPTTLQTMGSYIAMGNKALTNLTVVCPRLATLNQGLASSCSSLQHAELVCTNLTKVAYGEKDYVAFWKCPKLRKLGLKLPNLKELPKYFAVGNMGDTDATDWDLSSVTNVASYAFDMTACDSYEGPYGTLSLPALETMEGDQQFLCCAKLTGLRLGSGKLRNLGGSAKCTAGMRSLKCVELGLAAENEIRNDVFKRYSDSHPAAPLTNVTFTAAPPTTGDLFTALAATHTVPEDGSKTLTYVADFDQPGWTDAYLSDMGIDTQVTDAEAAELAKLSRKERRWFRGVVWTTKRYAWLFAQPKQLGMVIIAR